MLCSLQIVWKRLFNSHQLLTLKSSKNSSVWKQKFIKLVVQNDEKVVPEDQWRTLQDSYPGGNFLRVIIHLCSEENKHFNKNDGVCVTSFDQLAKSAFECAVKDESSLRKQSGPLLCEYAGLTGHLDGDQVRRIYKIVSSDHWDKLAINDKMNMLVGLTGKCMLFDESESYLKSNPALASLSRHQLIENCLRNDATDRALTLMAIPGWVIDVTLSGLSLVKRLCEKISCESEAEKLLNILSEPRQLRTCKKVTIVIAKLCERFGWDVQECKVSDSGFCEYSSEKLQSIALSKEEFNELHKSFVSCTANKPEFDRVVHLYKEERQRLDTIKQRKQYNVIVDAANVAYVLAGNRPRREGTIQAIRDVSLELAKQDFRNVLFICRGHLLGRRMDEIDTIKLVPGADIFTVNATKQDDLYILQSCMDNGQQCHFISDDYYRDHKFELPDPTTRRLFERWRLSRQISFRSSRSLGISLIKPIDYLPVVQRGKSAWYLPVSDPLNNQSMASHGLPLSWIVIEKHKSNKFASDGI